ncbi:unnamed protein product [Paramecium primaurelia]|uniref:Uncharacterized protein n=1 Tax=Paramecium primaurelia TaxID=5886 RepID=A0A8S1LPV7_PARPR|nr:unnamed protein product [Paramecium primaurelia]
MVQRQKRFLQKQMSIQFDRLILISLECWFIFKSFIFFKI